MVVDDVAGMGDPLPAGDELVFGRFPERVAHAAVIAAEADAAFDRGSKRLRLFLGDLRHGVDRHDEAEVGDGGIGKGGGGGLDADAEAFRLQHVLHDAGALLGLVAGPATPDDQGFPHGSLPQACRRSPSTGLLANGLIA